MITLGHHYPVYINLVMLLHRKSGTTVAISKMHIGSPFTTDQDNTHAMMKTISDVQTVQHVKSALMHTGGLVLSKAEII